MSASEFSIFSTFLGEVVANRTYLRNDECSIVDALNRYISMLPENVSLLASKFLRERKVAPSMRMLAFAPYARDEMYYNCSYLLIDSFEAFGEVLYLLSCGCGVGFSVERAVISRLPRVPRGYRARYVIGDCRESWADAVVMLCKNPDVEFEYDLIRPAGSPLSIGGTASGAEPLRDALEKIRKILKQAQGCKLTSVQVFDICCYIADAIVAGGVRRSAMIALFDREDEGMMRAKSGEWWRDNPQRARANISAVLYADVTEREFAEFLRYSLQNNGEPGYFYRMSNFFKLEPRPKIYDGLNPCGEIGLRPRQFCNLTEVVLSNVGSFAELQDSVRAAVALGTWQAAFTDFQYLPTAWREACEEDRLLGVSFTGIAQSFFDSLDDDYFHILKHIAEQTNEVIAKSLGINKAKRIFCVKPSGTTSVVYGCSSGVHLPYAPRYIRRVRLEQRWLIDAMIDIFGEPQPYRQGVYQPLEIDAANAASVVFCAPIAMDSRCGYATDADALDKQLVLLERASQLVALTSPHDVRNGVSCTLHVREGDVDKVASFLYSRRCLITRCTVFPAQNDSDFCHAFQLPFEKVSESTFKEAISRYHDLFDLELLSRTLQKHKSEKRVANPSREISCGGGSCELF